MRHLQKYMANKYEGANYEPEVDHLMGILFNVLGIAHAEEMKKGDNSTGNKS